MVVIVIIVVDPDFTFNSVVNPTSLQIWSLSIRDATICLCTETFLLTMRLEWMPTLPFFSSPVRSRGCLLTTKTLNFYFGILGFQIKSMKISSRSPMAGV